MDVGGDYYSQNSEHVGISCLMVRAESLSRKKHQQLTRQHRPMAPQRLLRRSQKSSFMHLPQQKQKQQKVAKNPTEAAQITGEQIIDVK